jgi:hypothetical protein
MADPKDGNGPKEKDVVKDAIATKDAVENVQREERGTPKTGEQKDMPAQAQNDRTPTKPQTPEETRIQQMKERDRGGSRGGG